MKRKVIKGLSTVDWSDTLRQNEYVHSVVSALGGLDDKLDYDTVCAVSGSAFRTSFSTAGWNHGNYHVVHTPGIIKHTFKMLGYNATHHVRSDYESDRQLIVNSIDAGIPVISLEGVVNCADACVISGYDDGGDVLLGYSPFMYISDDHPEPHDESGYFRKSKWHDGFSAEGSKLRIIIIEGACSKPSCALVFDETMKLAVHLIESDRLVDGQHNGLAAHKAFANALLMYDWNDNFEPYLNVMCNYKQYLDRRYAARYLHDHGCDELAAYYDQITALCATLGTIIPQDFSAGDMFSDKTSLRPYADVLMKIRDTEAAFISKYKEFSS